MITIKSKEEIKILREGGKILAEILKQVADKVGPGVKTGELERLALSLIKQAGGRPSFKGYKTRHDLSPFPTALCTSINDEVVHAPSLPSRKLNEGDIIGIDIGMEYPYRKKIKGYYTDIAVTVPVGKINEEARKLIKTTRECLDLAISKAKEGVNLNTIGRTIQTQAEGHGYAVVRELVGHGVGYDVHEEPQVPNFEIKGEGKTKKVILKAGMVIAIEPMVNIGGWKVKSAFDGFTILTADGTLSAHFEHTVAITESGCEIITTL
ncbi:MAG: type I methionyl aminopeptidase [Patescibacteria group bacterium]